MNITLSPRADQYVRSKVTRRADLGRFISELIVEQQVREQCTQAQAHQQPTSRQEWPDDVPVE